MLREEEKNPYSIRNKGTVICEPGEVAKIVHRFFSRLYCLPDMLPADAQERRRGILQTFLDSCALPNLSREALKSLNNPIVAEEIEEVLKLLPSGSHLALMGLHIYITKLSKSSCLPI